MSSDLTSAASEQTRLRTTARLWVAAYLVATFGGAALLKMGIISGWKGMALFAASFLLLIPLVRSAERARAACGISSNAMRVYNRRVIVAALIYVVLLLGGVTIAHYYAPPAGVRVLLALAAAAPILFMIRAMALLLREERDEYLKMRFVQQSLIATGFLLTLATLYGFLNVFDLAPRLDAYLAVPVWAIGLAVGRLLGRDGAC